MSIVTHDWMYIPYSSAGGRAALLERRGWDVGEPVHLPSRDYQWQQPCSRRVDLRFRAPGDLRPERLRAARIQAEGGMLTMRLWAERLEVAYGTVQRWETTGRNISRKHLLAYINLGFGNWDHFHGMDDQ